MKFANLSRHCEKLRGDETIFCDTLLSYMNEVLNRTSVQYTLSNIMLTVILVHGNTKAPHSTDMVARVEKQV